MALHGFEWLGVQGLQGSNVAFLGGPPPTSGMTSRASPPTDRCVVHQSGPLAVLVLVLVLELAEEIAGFQKNRRR